MAILRTLVILFLNEVENSDEILMNLLEDIMS